MFFYCNTFETRYNIPLYLVFLDSYLGSFFSCNMAYYLHFYLDKKAEFLAWNVICQQHLAFFYKIKILMCYFALTSNCSTNKKFLNCMYIFGEWYSLLVPYVWRKQFIAKSSAIVKIELCELKQGYWFCKMTNEQ